LFIFKRLSPSQVYFELFLIFKQNIFVFNRVTKWSFRSCDDRPDCWNDIRSEKSTVNNMQELIVFIMQDKSLLSYKIISRYWKISNILCFQIVQRHRNRTISSSLGSTHPTLITENGMNFNFSGVSRDVALWSLNSFQIHYYQDESCFFCNDSHDVIWIESRNELPRRIK
jgi:hypothetical protein